MSTQQQTENGQVHNYLTAMARRVIIRSRKLSTAVAQVEEMVAADYKEIWKEHIEDLEAIADWVVQDARVLAPVDTGKLRDSIKAAVSKSPRYPGLMVSASAKAKYKKSFDYALIQEENEDFSHEVGQAHYLSEPFFNLVDEFYFEYTGKHLVAPEVNRW